MHARASAHPHPDPGRNRSRGLIVRHWLMANPILSPRSWPWRLAVAVGLPWLFGSALARGVGPPGGAARGPIEFRFRLSFFAFLVLLGLLRGRGGRPLRETGLLGGGAFARRFSEDVALGTAP